MPGASDEANDHPSPLPLPPFSHGQGQPGEKNCGPREGSRLQRPENNTWKAAFHPIPRNTQQQHWLLRKQRTSLLRTIQKTTTSVLD